MPRAYYNEIDPYCANWLYNLIHAGLIADGDIDTRSIVDVRPSDLKGYTQCHFFAGLGGWSGALRLAGWPDDREVWTGSCPCQPFSLAGKQGGFADERHLWPSFRYLIAVEKPPVVFGEQVASATEWLRLVRSDLEALDYAVGCMPVQAASAGADHLRDRYWFVADNGSGRCPRSQERQGEQPRRAEALGTSDSGINMGVADGARRSSREQATTPSGHRSAAIATGSILADTDDARSQGRVVLPECAGERIVGPNGVADSDIVSQSEGWQQRSGQQRGPRSNSEACDSSDMDNTKGERRDGIESTPRSDWGISAEITSRSSAPDATIGSNIGGKLWTEQRIVSSGRGENRSYEWVIGADGKARRVKSRLCCRFDGVSFELDGLRAVIAAQAAEEIKTHAEKTGESFSEVMQAVRETVRAHSVWQAESLGGQGRICAPEVLLSFLLGYEPACASSLVDSRFAQARGKDDLGHLRILRVGDYDFGAPCRRQPDEQRPEQPAAALLALSLILACCAETLRQATDTAYAETIPLLISGVPARVAKLRALGNAIDLRPAAEFIKAFDAITELPPT